jgi:hypothetical protein
VVSPQIHADLRAAWKLLQDAGHQGAADRVFEFLSHAADQMNGQRTEVDLAALAAGADPRYMNITTQSLITHLIPGDEPGMHHTLVVGHSVKGKSLLSRLSEQQLQALNAWSVTAPRSSTGSVNVMDWPGWAELAPSGTNDGNN